MRKSDYKVIPIGRCNLDAFDINLVIRALASKRPEGWQSQRGYKISLVPDILGSGINKCIVYGLVSKDVVATGCNITLFRKELVEVIEQFVDDDSFEAFDIVNRFKVICQYEDSLESCQIATMINDSLASSGVTTGKAYLCQYPDTGYCGVMIVGDSAVVETAKGLLNTCSSR